jgi:crossover junction endodeoxyribonuclease RusA
MFEVELPYPPSINHYWRRVGNRTLISREGRVFRRKVLSILRTLNPLCSVNTLAVSIEVYPPDRRRRDLDNLLKSLLDAMQHGGLYQDDSQIVQLQIEKKEVVPNGKTVVQIREVACSH